MEKVIDLEKFKMKTKRISVSNKRQITIPLEYFKALNIGNEVECIMKDNSIIIRPILTNSEDNFADLILQDLIEEGYEGQELLKKFRERKLKNKEAIDKIIKEADMIAENEVPYSTLENVFKEEE